MTDVPYHLKIKKIKKYFFLFLNLAVLLLCLYSENHWLWDLLALSIFWTLFGTFYNRYNLTLIVTCPMTFDSYYNLCCIFMHLWICRICSRFLCTSLWYCLLQSLQLSKYQQADAHMDNIQHTQEVCIRNIIWFSAIMIFTKFSLIYNSFFLFFILWKIKLMLFSPRHLIMLR